MDSLKRRRVRFFPRFGRDNTSETNGRSLEGFHTDLSRAPLLMSVTGISDCTGYWTTTGFAKSSSPSYLPTPSRHQRKKPPEPVTWHCRESSWLLPSWISSQRNGNSADIHGVARMRRRVWSMVGEQVSRRPQPRPTGTSRPARSAKPEYLARHAADQPPLSATSSLDGYDSLENTNNKKRKIPSAGEAINGVHSLDANTGNAAHSPTHEGQSDAASTGYYGSGSLSSGSPGISGPGRGRYGRARNGRSPLRTLTDATSNWVGRNGKLRPSQWASPPGEQTRLGLFEVVFLCLP